MKSLFLLILMVFFLSACSTGWSNRHTKITAYGMYAVHPMYGVLGLGYIDYEREPGEAEEGDNETLPGN